MTQYPITNYDQFEFHDDIKKIILDIQDDLDFRHKPYQGIIALSRGGLIPGVVISHNLSIPLIALNWSKNKKEVNERVWERVRYNERYLIVDDMVDSGVLLKELFESFDEYDADLKIDPKNLDVAVLINNTDVSTIYENKLGSFRTKFFGKAISKQLKTYITLRCPPTSI